MLTDACVIRIFVLCWFMFMCAIGFELFHYYCCIANKRSIPQKKIQTQCPNDALLDLFASFILLYMLHTFSYEDEVTMNSHQTFHTVYVQFQQDMKLFFVEKSGDHLITYMTHSPFVVFRLYGPIACSKAMSISLHSSSMSHSLNLHRLNYRCHTLPQMVSVSIDVCFYH